MTMPSPSKTTSRVGRKPVNLPAGVDVKLHHNQFSAKGPKGQLTLDLHQFVNVVLENNQIIVQENKENNKAGKKLTGASKKLNKCIVGATRANINNIIIGVNEGFEEKLTLIGVGYRAQTKGKLLSLSLGFSHPTDFDVPEGITIETPTQTEILIKGADRALVGETAATIRKIRPPERYKGKGVRYAKEKIELKETKKK
jgi:large subunit ribosomal protein L6